MSLVNIKGSNSETGATYWRSLNQLADTPEFRDWVVKEFPGGTDMLDGQSRRNVLKLMAASFGLAGLAACRRPVEHILPYSHGVEDLIPGQAYFYSTVVSLAGQATGLLVETHDGRPTKIEGNPDHPASLGVATAMQQAAILSLYDPDGSVSGEREADFEELERVRGVSKDDFAGRWFGRAVPERDGEFAVALRGS